MAESETARAIPEADFVSLHGLWTWVPQVVQAGVVRLLAAKVRPGGAVHVSYNSLPGWGGVFGMQRVLHEVGRRSASRSDRQAEEGLKFVRALYETEALQLVRAPLVKSLLERIDTMPSQYLAHEYMNDHWAPCFMADVAAQLAEAKLEWVASAQLVENFPDLTFNDAQRALAQQFDDPMLRELMKDTCIERMLRHDVFVRGARRIGTTARDAALMDVQLSLNIAPEDMPLEADMPAGRAELSPAFYRPIAQAMQAGPRRVRDLLQLPDVEGRRDNPAELIGILVGLDIAEPAVSLDAPPGEAAMRFNRFATRRMALTEPLGRVIGVASRRLGTGLHASLCDLILMDRMLDGDAGVDDLMQSLGSRTDEPERLREALEKSLRSPHAHSAGGRRISS